MRVLCVAEKPSMAKAITEILSRRHYDSSAGRNRYCRNFTFTAEIGPQQLTCQVLMTSALGHLLAPDLVAETKNWSAISPDFLFTAAIDWSSVSDECKGVVENLKIEARHAQWLVLWTDCDREGEYIGHEIATVCLESNPSIQVWRARYSVVGERELRRAATELCRLDDRQVKAVALRIELDLRTGAALTRLLTLRLRERFSAALDQQIVSYGSCQFPTLGFVVEQWLRRERFVPEATFSLHLQASCPKKAIDFSWSRGCLYDRITSIVLFQDALNCCSSATAAAARVLSCTSLPTSRRRPLPLTTVELLKFCSGRLRIQSQRVMKIAEDLYNRGLISYPRTETNQFPRGFPFSDTIAVQTGHPEWGSFASALLRDASSLQVPRSGSSNDNAHPPIHPTASAVDLAGDEAKIYAFVVRRFLAGCSCDATGVERRLQVSIPGGEVFFATGLTVIDRGYLEVYPWDTWESRDLPDCTAGDFLPILQLQLKQGETVAPLLLSEAQLIGTMDKNGIGTDATIHEHIKKILDRGYALQRRKDQRFEPTPLGLGLVVGHDSMVGLEQSLTKPQFRASIERQLKEIEGGKRDKSVCLRELVEIYQNIYNQINRQLETLFECMKKYLDTPINKQESQPSAGKKSSQTEENVLCKCNLPAKKLVTRKYNPPKAFYRCSSDRCDFFEWEKAQQPSQPSQAPQSSRPPQPSQPSASVKRPAEKTVKCDCGLPSQKQQSRTERSAGKFFYSCPKSTQRCKFFIWIDNS